MEFGEIMKWGKHSGGTSGSDEARARIATLTQEELEKGGVTKQIAKAWRDFYNRQTEANPGNPSSPGRTDLMQKAYELLGGEPEKGKK
jgi:hypothetical protein